MEIDYIADLAVEQMVEQTECDNVIVIIAKGDSVGISWAGEAEEIKDILLGSIKVIFDDCVEAERQAGD